MAWVPRMWSRAETSVPSGWLPWMGCSSCRGSPRRTTLRRGLRYREHIRQAHLRGLVHEQNIDRLVKFWARPEPRCTAGDMTAGFESFQCLRRCQSRTEGLGGLSSGSDTFCTQRIANPVSVAVFLAPSSKLRMTLWLLAVIPRRFPDRAKRAQHMCAGMRLARTRRSLDGKHAASQVGGDPDRS